MLKTKFINFFKTKKVNIFLVFLVLSFSFLMLTKLSKDYTQTISFNIEKINIPQEKVIIEDSSHKLNITLKTYGFKLIQYLLYKPKLKIDFSKLDKNQSYYHWTDKDNRVEVINQLNANVEIISINPDTLFFKYDENFVKTVPIVLKDDIQYSIGYDLLKPIEMTPDSIKVIGPKVLLDTIYNVTSETLKLQDVNSNISSLLKIKKSTNNQIKYSSESILVEASVTKFTEGELEIPIDILNVPETISLSFYPKTVKVFFYTSLQDYNKISSSDFKVECDYRLIDETIDFFEPKVVLKPRFVKNVRLNTNKIEFIIKQ